MRADDLQQARLHRQRLHRFARLRPGGVGHGHFVQRQHLPGAGGELDFHHRQQRPARALHDVVAQRVVQHCGAIAAQLDLAARRFVVKAVAQQRQQGVVVGKRAEQVMLSLAKTRHGGSKDQRMQRRRLQLVAHGAVDRLGLQKVVGIDRLRRAAPGLDLLVKDTGGHHHRMQKGPASQPAMRIGRARAQQYRRRVDGAAGQNIMLRYYFRSYLCRRSLRKCPIWLDSSADQRADPAVGQFKALGAGFGQQLRAQVECRRDGGDQHRLLGIGRAAQPARAQIPAALDIARDGLGVNAELARATAQQGIVFIGRHLPRRDVQPLLGLREIWRQGGFGVAGQAEAVLPELQRRSRRSKGTRPVHRRRAADAAALQNVDGLVLGLARRAFLVERRIGFGFQLVEVAAALERAFLDHHDLKPGFGQQFGGDARASAAANDGDIADDFFRYGPECAAQDFPAALQAVPDRVVQ